MVMTFFEGERFPSLELGTAASRPGFGVEWRAITRIQLDVWWWMGVDHQRSPLAANKLGGLGRQGVWGWVDGRDSR
jgi:hypothetical protein